MKYGRQAAELLDSGGGADRALVSGLEVGEALKSGVPELQFGRTSELIKSAVGALPVDMTIYIKHKRSLSNLILKNVIQSVKPSPFELRKPFKANFK